MIDLTDEQKRALVKIGDEETGTVSLEVVKQLDAMGLIHREGNGIGLTASGDEIYDLLTDERRK